MPHALYRPCDDIYSRIDRDWRAQEEVGCPSTPPALCCFCVFLCTHLCATHLCACFLALSGAAQFQMCGALNFLAMPLDRDVCRRLVLFNSQPSAANLHYHWVVYIDVNMGSACLSTATAGQYTKAIFINVISSMTVYSHVTA